MNELFGVSMTIISAVAIALTLVIFVILAYLGWRNPVMFKMGVRNIPRRPAQTVLIVVGLMLSTLIMSAAFTTGDTLARSIDAEIYRLLGPVDEVIQYNSEDFPTSEERQVITIAEVDAWQAALADNPDVAGLLPAGFELLPVLSQTTGLKESNARIVAYEMDDADAFGGLNDTNGNAVTLTGNQIAVNEELAGELDAGIGDELSLFIGGEPVAVTVAAIVPNSALTGSFNPTERQGGVVDLAFFNEVLGREGVVDIVLVTNDGTERGGLDLTSNAAAAIEPLLADTPYELELSKQDGVEEAQLQGSIFTTIFVVFGLFSIAAGVLLIFLIFVMLAAERKPEMGMARAVGARRRHLIESFLAEGMAYDLGSALVGAVAGIAVAFGMVSFVEWFFGDELGIDLSLAVSPRSLVTAFCFGIIATFLVISIASIRASRLNIVAAIRDLPESRSINSEERTWIGYMRGALNGMAAFGGVLVSLMLVLRWGTDSSGLLLLFLLGAALSAIGPWIYVLRGNNFSAPSSERKQGARLPIWPFVVGLVLLPVFGLGILLWLSYGLAIAIVRLTRDRRPARISAGMMVAGIIIPPLGMVVAALQDREKGIAWSVGVGVISGLIGAIWVEWGLDSNQAFFFLGGISLVLLWVVLTLRFFAVQERASFTIASALLLILWYMPSSWFEDITGELSGDFEMFFLSGVTMVTAGTFIIVYNADLLLPPIARLGSRFGRFYPAVRMAVAYPLVSRFRTGMTIAMIGLISFALIMFSTVNANFDQIFLGDESTGGWDIYVPINSNNPIDGFEAELTEAGVDTEPLETVAGIRSAQPFETAIKDPEAVPDPDDPEYGQFRVIGADEAFLTNNELEFDSIAEGYGSADEVWQALADDPTLAVIPAVLTVGVEFGPPGSENQLVVDRELTDGFEPFQLAMRDPATGEDTMVTVIGQMKTSADTFFGGIILNESTFEDVFPEARGQIFFLQLEEGSDLEEYARQVEAGIITASAESIPGLLDEFQRQSQGFLLLFQGFMGLGLIVGIAALGVIAFRAVVERRQQIGMLRAIGYRRSLVAATFVFESSFIALSGILMGLVLGVSLAWVLFTTGEIDDAASEVTFIVPWVQLLVICGIAFGASLLMTVIPARSASSVLPAEALRFE